MDIITACLHQINIQDNKIKVITINPENEDLENYVTKLLAEVIDKEQKRKFSFTRKTTEFYHLLTKLYGRSNFDEEDIGESFAQRLLDKEVIAEDAIKHLSYAEGGHVKTGSFLQIFYKNAEGAKFYLGVKVDHQEFLDETDFIKKIGLSFSKKVYKACSVDFATDGLPVNICVYDTNRKIAKYWYQSFLELKVLNTNESNTEEAFTRVNQSLGRLKDKYPKDYTILRNATISAFKQEGAMDYPDFVATVFENYTPESAKFAEKLPAFLDKLKELPEKYNFDTQFNLVPKVIKSRKTVYKLSEEIDITLKDSINNLRDKVWGQVTEDGKEVVVIHSPEGYQRFQQRPEQLA